MGLLKNISIGLLSFLLVLTLTLLSLAFSLNHLVYIDVYKDSLEKNGVDKLISEYVSNIPQIEISEVKIDPLELVKLPNDGVKGLFYQKIDGGLSYLRGDSETIDLKIYLNNEKISYLLEQNAANFPTCNDYLKFSTTQPVCRPAEMSVQTFSNNHLTQLLPEQLRQEYYDLQPLLDKDNKLNEFRNYFHLYQIIIYSLIASTMILLLGLFFLLKDNLKAFFRTISGSIFFIGISNLITGVILRTQLPELINKIGPQNQDTINTFIKSVTLDLIQSIISKIELIGIIMAVTGILLFGLSFLFKNKDK